jgi:hypothetical protein
MIKVLSFAAILLLFFGCSEITSPSVQEDTSIEMTEFSAEASSTETEADSSSVNRIEEQWNGGWGSEGYIW